MTNWLKRNFSHAAKIDIAAQGKGQVKAALDEQCLSIVRTIDRKFIFFQAQKTRASAYRHGHSTRQCSNFVQSG